MAADQLVHLFKHAADNSDDVTLLRRFIVDLAVRGKLVEQCADEEPALDLLKQIKLEKEKLLSSGMLRNKVVDISAVTEIPFKIPETWVWVSLGTAFIYDAGIKRNSKELDPSFWLLELEDIEKETGHLKRKVYSGQRTSKSTKSEFRAGDILYGKLRPYLNKVVVADAQGYSTTEIVAIRPYLRLCSHYCALALRRSDFLEYVTKFGQGTKMPRLRTNDAVTAPFPLPPLAEQHRIVTKVDELMALCGRLEEAQKKRDESRNLLTKASFGRLNDSKTDDLTFHSISNFVINQFPVLTRKADQVKTLRQSILNLAIRGKLVAQDPAEGSALELLPQIALEKERMEKGRAIRKQKHLLSVTSPPFEIPSNWRWVKFGDIIKFSAGKTPPRKELRFWNTGDYSWVCIGDIPNGQTLLETKETVSEEARSIIFKSNPSQPGTIILSFKLTIGKIARLGVPAYFNEAIISICPIIEKIEPYLFTFLPLFARSGKSISAVKGETLNRNSISNIQIPLPPLAEQHRIVAKVDELMALCDRLESNLEITSACQVSLFESLVSNTLQQEKSTRDSANTIARGFTV